MIGRLWRLLELAAGVLVLLGWLGALALAPLVYAAVTR